VAGPPLQGAGYAVIIELDDEEASYLLARGDTDPVMGRVARKIGAAMNASPQSQMRVLAAAIDTLLETIRRSHG
jgi:hypothetical protein